MTEKNNYTGLNALFTQSFVKHSKLKAFSDYGGGTYTYGQVAGQISRIHRFFGAMAIQHGDRIALLGRNSSNWGIAFLAIITYGAVAVPVLPDFPTADIHHILKHSGSRFLFVANSFVEKLDREQLPEIDAVINLSDLTALWSRSKKLKEQWLDAAEQPFSIKDFKLPELEPEHVCVISYTSGTSGLSKGVMIPARSLWSNIVYAQEHMPLKPRNQLVSFLPMAHVFGLLFEYLFPSTLGCQITFLSKAPTPAVIVKAFKEIRPHLILSVPLVIEKIYRKQIQPKIEKGMIKFLLKLPGIRGIIYRSVRNKLIATFGGRFYELIIGGAAMSEDVESFFRKIQFRFTVGYGMTECGPLISYDDYKTTRPMSAGRLVDRMEVRIDSPDPYKQVGEILVRGMNLMKGYYLNERATSDAIDTDGWLHTGDLGIINKKNYVFIRGRCKNMFLSANGQNIYPEEIEVKLSAMSYVSECVVTERNGKITGIVFPDADALKAEKIPTEKIPELMETTRLSVNMQLPKYSQIAVIETVTTEFEKTPKRNIKRYLYT
ncbi:MAG: AMP-binding protein [Bacteroidales bacterium]|nr:AMP-binding protein [Bacteroidales bacterium]